MRGIRRRASWTCACLAGCRREPARAASSIATCCTWTAWSRNQGRRTPGRPNTSCWDGAVSGRPLHGTCRPACGHILPGARSGGRRGGPLVPCSNRSGDRFIPRKPPRSGLPGSKLRRGGDTAEDARCPRDGRDQEAPVATPPAQVMVRIGARASPGKPACLRAGRRCRRDPGTVGARSGSPRDQLPRP